MLALKRFIIRPLFLFCLDHKKRSLTLTRSMLNKYKELQPWKNIRMLYSITMAHQDLAITSQHIEYKQDKLLITQVIENLSNSLHQVAHREINILMEVLKQQGIKYDRDLSIYRALNKQAKMLFGKDMKAELLPRSLQYLKVLNFPKFTVNKLLDQLVRTTGRSTIDKKEEAVMKTSTMLEIAIFCMEQPYVTFPILTKWVKAALSGSANSLSALCYLYHLVKITDKCLHRKIEYQYQKTNAKELLFNSYEEVDQATKQQPKQQKKRQDKCKKDEQEQIQQVEVKQQLTAISQQLVKMINQVVDVKNLEKSIVKNVQDNIEPFNKDFLLYTCEISQLKYVVEQFAKKEFGSLTPVELIYLLKRCSKHIVGQIVNEYLTLLSKHMSVEQKVYIYLQSHQQFDIAVTKQQIFQLLNQIEHINYSQFMAITRLTQLLRANQRNSIRQILELIKSKMQSQSTSK